MKHIVDNVNNLKITLKTLDLAGRVPFTDSIELLSVELQYHEGHGPLFMGRVRYAIDGVKQEEGFPLDLHKGAFIATVRIQEAGLEDKLQAVGPDIARIVYEDLAAQRRALSSSVLAKIAEITTAFTDGDYIYRGESKYHDKVYSSLYREYEADIEAENFDIAVVEEEILREAREYTTSEMTDSEIRAKLQHHGGKTNLIDFTTDYLVALFFACGGDQDEPGRVILLQKQSEVYEVLPAPRTIKRAGFQKSIFVRSPSGVVEPDLVVCIPADLKRDMLDYLRKHHDISTKTIYNDLQGFIENQRIHKSAYTEFFKGFTYQVRANSTKNPTEERQWYNKAIAHYTEAIRLNPEDAVAYNNRGYAYAEKGEIDNAIQDYNKAIELNPESDLAYTNRGNAYAEKGEIDNAIQNYNKAITLNPESAAAYYNRGYAYNKKSEIDNAIKDYNKAITLNPELDLAYTNRGNAYAEKGEFDNAIQNYNKAITLNPENAETYNNRGNAYYHKGEIDKVIEDYNKAITLNPENAVVYTNRGLAYYHKGEIDNTIQDYNKAITLNPENAVVYTNRGNAYAEKGEIDNAIQDYSTAIELNPEYAQAYYNRGVAYAEKGEIDNAIQDYNTTIELNPEFAQAYNNRAVAYREKGEVDKAIQDFNKAIDLKPESANAYNNRGYAYQDKGELDAAIQDYNRAIILNPELDAAYYNRGNTYYRKRELDAAIQDYNRAITLNPELPEAYTNRGEVWLHLKEWEKAKADLINAKNMGFNIVASFHNDYESVKDFEAKLDVKVPEDIAALLSQD